MKNFRRILWYCDTTVLHKSKVHGARRRERVHSSEFQVPSSKCQVLSENYFTELTQTPGPRTQFQIHSQRQSHARVADGRSWEKFGIGIGIGKIGDETRRYSADGNWNPRKKNVLEKMCESASVRVHKSQRNQMSFIQSTKKVRPPTEVLYIRLLSLPSTTSRIN